MARYTGPKNKLARREGLDLGLKSPSSGAHSSLLRKLNIPPGQHGVRGRRKESEYSIQLREKQRARRIYGVLEKQFQRYFAQALKTRGATGAKLLQLLELRLDNVLYRLALAPTRASARQLISHGHVTVNGKKVTIPSYSVSEGQVISVKAKSLSMPVVAEMLKEKNPVIPAWFQRQGPAGKVAKLPQREDIDTILNEQLIVEYYSR
ncbi:30S ribosomal protein S4 [Candidatus Gottesmanbacteria bacterium]|nr:30S ribosomal protein S4 [Candidatus Gottesmanbacteria bacterium]